MKRLTEAVEKCEKIPAFPAFQINANCIVLSFRSHKQILADQNDRKTKVWRQP
jgi:hypothetical protein